MIDQRNFHQSPEEIIKNATAEQRVIWNALFLLCGDKMSIAQLYFCGLSAGTEFLTYRARRIYFALELEYGRDNNASTLGDRIELYNENNVLNMAVYPCSVYWNTVATAAVTYGTHAKLQNIYFSRTVPASNYDYLKFLGFRIIY